MAIENHRALFAERLRTLRNVEGSSIEEASGRGEVSANFWGAVERNEQEPCLDVIMGFAKGLGISAAALFSFHGQEAQGENRKNLDALLDLCSPQEVQLLHQIADLIYKSNRDTHR